MMKFTFFAARDGDTISGDVMAPDYEEAQRLARHDIAKRFGLTQELDEAATGEDWSFFDAELDGFTVEDITQPHGGKLMIWIASADCDGGTQGDAFASEREAEDWIINKLDGDASRDDLDAWLADPVREEDGGNFFDYVDAHRRDDLDTFNMDSKELEIPAALPMPVQPVRIVVAIDGGLVQGASANCAVELAVIDYDVEGDDAAATIDRHAAAIEEHGFAAALDQALDGVAQPLENLGTDDPALDQNDPAEVVRAGLDLLEAVFVPWVIPTDANNLRFLHIHSETDEARVYRVHIIRES